MYNGNGPGSIIVSAFLVGLIAWIIGMLIGSLFLRTVNEHIERHRAANPIPSDDIESGLDTNTDPAQAAAG